MGKNFQGTHFSLTWNFLLSGATASKSCKKALKNFQEVKNRVLLNSCTKREPRAEHRIQEFNGIIDCSTGCHIRNSFSSLGFSLELAFLSADHVLYLQKPEWGNVPFVSQSLRSYLEPVEISAGVSISKKSLKENIIDWSLLVHARKEKMKSPCNSCSGEYINSIKKKIECSSVLWNYLIFQSFVTV